jgi:hypothetical protein
VSSPKSDRRLDIAFVKVVPATATPIGIPRVRKKAYIEAAIAQSSGLDIACTAMFMDDMIMPAPIPKTARTP